MLGTSHFDLAFREYVVLIHNTGFVYIVLQMFIGGGGSFAKKVFQTMPGAYKVITDALAISIII